jgi:hypothetical protein
MNLVCGFCGHFRPDSDFPFLFGECTVKGRYVAFYSICDLGKWVEKNQ